MNKKVLCAFLAFLPVSLFAEERITVDAKFIQWKPYFSVPHDLAKLTNTKGIHVTSAPRVTARSGSEATVALTRTFRVGNIHTAHPYEFPTGAILHLTPIIKDGKIAYRADLTVREYIGQSSPANPKQYGAEFQSRELYLSGILESGTPTWVELKQKNAGSKLALWLQLSRKAA